MRRDASLIAAGATTSMNTEAVETVERARLGWPLTMAWLAALLVLHVWGLRDYEFRNGVQSVSWLVSMFLVEIGVCYVVALLVTALAKRRLPRAKGVLVALTVSCLLLAWFPTPRHRNYRPASITNVVSAGNLASTHEVGCIALSAASNQYTPADLYRGVFACLQAGDVPRAVQLHLLAESYGNFDIGRVQDRTAHQALRALQAPVFGRMDERQRAAWKAEAVRLQRGDVAKVCADLRKLGPPAYYPRYMIEHGMGAFISTGKPALVANFDAARYWERVLGSPYACGLAAGSAAPT